MGDSFFAREQSMIKTSIAHMALLITFGSNGQRLVVLFYFQGTPKRRVSRVAPIDKLSVDYHTLAFVFLKNRQAPKLNRAVWITAAGLLCSGNNN